VEHLFEPVDNLENENEEDLNDEEEHDDAAYEYDQEHEDEYDEDGKLPDIIPDYASDTSDEVNHHF
jgi:hypothetical protein